jgi:hypothetical protein
MFKPSLDDFCTALRDHSPDFRHFMRSESAVEGKSEVIQPHFTLAAGFEDVDMHSFHQIIAVKADSIAVLNKNRWHGDCEPAIPPTPNQIKTVSRPNLKRAKTDQWLE